MSNMKPRQKNLVYFPDTTVSRRQAISAFGVARVLTILPFALGHTGGRTAMVLWGLLDIAKMVTSRGAWKRTFCTGRPKTNVSMQCAYHMKNCI